MRGGGRRLSFFERDTSGLNVGSDGGEKVTNQRRGVHYREKGHFLRMQAISLRGNQRIGEKGLGKKILRKKSRPQADGHKGKSNQQDERGGTSVWRGPFFSDKALWRTAVR